MPKTVFDRLEKKHKRVPGALIRELALGESVLNERGLSYAKRAAIRVQAAGGSLVKEVERRSLSGVRVVARDIQRSLSTLLKRAAAGDWESLPASQMESMGLDEARSLIEANLFTKNILRKIKQRWRGWVAKNKADSFRDARERRAGVWKDKLADILSGTHYSDQDTFRDEFEAASLDAQPGAKPGTWHVLGVMESYESLYHWSEPSWRDVKYAIASAPFKSKYSPEDDPYNFWQDAYTALKKGVGDWLYRGRWGMGDWELEELEVTDSSDDKDDDKEGGVYGWDDY